MNNTRRRRDGCDVGRGAASRRFAFGPVAGEDYALASAEHRHYDPSILPRETTRSRQKSVPVLTVRLLLQDVAEGIRVLQTRDGVDLSNEQILERARNIVTGLLGNYRIRSIDDAREPSDTGGVHQMDLLDQIEARAEARNNGRPGRA
jgi:hypothetical protein